MSSVTGHPRALRLIAAGATLASALLMVSCGPNASTSAAPSSAAAASSSAPLPAGDLSAYPAAERAQLAGCAKNTSQPGAKVDGSISSAAAMCRVVTGLTQHYKVSSSDPQLEQAAVARYVYEALLYPEAAHDGISVTDARVHDTIQQIVDTYKRDPAAAQRAGFVIPAGQTLEQYFFDPVRVAEYRRLLVIGAERNHVEGSGSHSDRIKASATWLSHALSRHEVVVLNTSSFDLSSALLWLAWQQEEAVTAPPASSCIISPVPAPSAGIATPYAESCPTTP
jgi:hypothetical protein